MPYHRARLGALSVVRLIMPEVPGLGETLPAQGVLTPSLVVAACLNEGLQADGYLGPPCPGRSDDRSGLMAAIHARVVLMPVKDGSRL